MGEIIRAHRNCTNVGDLLHESDQIQNRLKHKKYPNWILKKAHNTALYKDRKSLLSNKNNLS